MDILREVAKQAFNKIKDMPIDEYSEYSDPNDPRLPWEKSEPVGGPGPKFTGSRSYQNLKGFRRK